MLIDETQILTSLRSLHLELLRLNGELTIQAMKWMVFVNYLLWFSVATGNSFGAAFFYNFFL